MSNDGRLARRLGWAALIAAVAATTLLVPPLISPKTQHRAATAVRSASPSPSVSPSPSASRSPSPRPSVARSSPSAGPSFTAISVQASDPANVRSGARIIECGTCDGGNRVGYIGGPNFLLMHIRRIPAAGRRTLTVIYETSDPRTLMIGVNGTTVRTLLLAGAHDLLIPAKTALSVFLPAGASLIKFFNDAGPAPDINGIVIS